MSLRALQRYSRYVNLMKVVLSLGIFLVLGFSLGGPYFISLGRQEKDELKEETVENRMIRPHYMARDKEGKPYEVRAEQAIRSDEGQPTDLKHPEGSLLLPEGQRLDVKAEQGTYDAQNNRLKLAGKVTLTSTDGYRVETAEASVLINEKIIEGDSPVEAEGPTGRLRGQRFKMEQKTGGYVITLEGQPQVIINQNNGS